MATILPLAGIIGKETRSLARRFFNHPVVFNLILLALAAAIASPLVLF